MDADLALPETEQPLPRAHLLWLRAFSLVRLENFAEADESLNAAQAEFARLGQPAYYATTLLSEILFSDIRDYKGRLALCDEAERQRQIQGYTPDAWIFILRSAVLEGLKLYAQAMDDVTKAEAILKEQGREDDPVVAARRASLLLAQRRNEEALSECERAAGLREEQGLPQSTTLLDGRAFALNNLGRYQAALLVLAEARRLRQEYGLPPSPRLARETGICLCALSRYEPALNALIDSLRLSQELGQPVDPSTMLWRGKTLYFAKRGKEAVGAFEEYRRFREQEGLSPDGEAEWWQGRLCQQQGRHADALAGFEEAVRIRRKQGQPIRSDLCQDLVETHSTLGNYSAALAVLDEYEQQSGRDELPQNAELLWERAVLLDRLQRPAEALEVYAAVLRLRQQEGQPVKLGAYLNRATDLGRLGRMKEAAQELDAAQKVLARVDEDEREQAEAELKKAQETLSEQRQWQRTQQALKVFGVLAALALLLYILGKLLGWV